MANAQRYCICITPSSLPKDERERLSRQRAALLKSARWDAGTEISVSFLEGSDFLRRRVRHHAESWIGTDMANLTFDWRDEGPSDIRIAFVPGDGSWSYLGTICRKITDQSAPTMNFGWLTDESGEDEIRSVVLHEFGHALGLIHEHQNPKGGIEWNEDAVIADLSGPPNEWDEDTIKRNVLDPYDPQAVQSTELDPASIMMYPIPNAWTVGDFSTGFNGELSERDRQLIRDAYPF